MALIAGDLETEPAAVDRMFDKIVATRCDEVTANCWLPDGGFTSYDPLKLVLNWIFKKMFRRAVLDPGWRGHAGFKILSREVVEAIAWGARGTRSASN